MRTIAEIRATPTLSVDELRAEIRIRDKLASDMVGWLYPSVLSGECAEITQIIRDKLRST